MLGAPDAHRQGTVWAAAREDSAGTRGCRRGLTMTTYLVTGATGFLGGQLVERLLADPEARVHVVVREGSRGKLAARARRWGGGDRVQVVVGDLLLPELGIDPTTLQE